MKSGILKAEGFLRFFSLGLLALTACLVGLDAQTKEIFFSLERKATFRDLNALLALVYVDSIAAGYNLLQLSKCFFISGFNGNPTGSYKNLAWVFFFLDQMAAYVCFAANLAATQASLLAVTGASQFQWMKICNRYTRFCIQIGGALLCGLIASLVMAVISSISAFNLFRLYSSKQFLVLKGK
ncbi:hypothetical protein HHK36_021150 [Tetracentron sinense]|uniref:CASP-like protein n=1 Tax=Tetracentron sinense TaxID=13715 RepID=A0A834YTE6_TETSI|nr:hypothetical protein HHK36_021150 [Tetracentron sinense]